MNKTTAAVKLSKTSIAYLNYMNGTGERPRCAIGTQIGILTTAGMIEEVPIPGNQYARMDVITEAGRAALASLS